MARRDEAALGLATSALGDARPSVVEARFDEPRSELEEVERRRSLPVGLVVFTEQVYEPGADPLHLLAVLILFVVVV